MRKFLILLPVILLGLFSCQRKNPSPAAPVKDPDYQKAASFLNRQNDSAFYYFNKVATGSKDSLQIARSYTNMAVIQSGAGDYFGSQESLLMSLKFLDPGKEKNRQCLYATYNELGLTSIDLKNYDAAITFFAQGIRFSKDHTFELIFLNNKALAYQKKGDYTRALALYRAILPQTIQPETYARVLSNMARTQWLARPGYHAAPALLKALAIRQKENDTWGENASYAHLADYYTPTRPDSALLYAGRMYTVALQLRSPDDQLEALQKLIRLVPPNETAEYFTRYTRLNDSLQTARNAARNQFALIRYEVEKNKADNLKLQKDNADNRYQIILQRTLLYGALVLLVAGTVIAWVWNRNTIRRNQLRLSKKVHDQVANGVYRIMTEVEHGKIDKLLLMDELEQVYERSRDISYEGPSDADPDFHQHIAALLTAFATPETKVLLTGNSAALWEKAGGKTRQEVEAILQELMVNMKKHSGAENVIIRFEQTGKQLRIDYLDDGKGLPRNHREGNGLRNTGNRIKAIRGSINFDGNGGKGLHVHISFPMQ